MAQERSNSTQVWLYWLAAALSRRLPRRCGYWCGLRIADYFFYRRTTERHAVIGNLRRICAVRGRAPAEATLPPMARKTFQHFGKYLVDFFRIAHLTEAQVRKFVTVENVAALSAAAARGRGVLAVTAHLGNWEVGGAVVAALGHRLNAVALPQSSQRLNRLFNAQRARRGIRVLPLGRAAFGIRRCLQRGEIVALLGDRNFHPSAERYEFFGAPAPLPRGPARLALRTGAPLVPIFLLRQDDDTFLLRCHPPIYPDVAGSEEAIRAVWLAVLEKEIAAAPWQWFLFEDFWK